MGNHIRSYALRQGRLTTAQERAYDRLSRKWCLDGAGGRFDPARAYPRALGLIIDIGFGMGETTAAMAEAHPDFGFLGLEVHKPGVGRLLMEIERRGLDNVRIFHGDAIPFIKDRLPPECLTGVHLFFPDPWPKTRHHKRRLVRPDFVEALVGRMKPGGYLFFVTDWEDYARQAGLVLAAASGLAPWSSTPPILRPRTAFEAKGLAAGRGIHEILYRKI